MKKIVIVADASIEIGIGHIMRCLTIANNLKKYSYYITFVMRNLPGNLIDYVIKQGYEHSFEYTKADLYIVDCYDRDIQDEKEMRNYTKYIMVIDDLANREHDCDILLDQSVLPDYSVRYDLLVPKHCIKHLGPQYLILRDEFLAVRQPRKIHSINRLLVFMGGSDPTIETLKVLKAPQTTSFEHVDIVVGSSNMQRQEIQKICIEKGYQYHQQINYMAELMSKADLSIGAGGITAWERSFIGLPSICTIVAENQRLGTTYAGQIGTCINLGWHEEVTVATYKNILNTVTVDKLQQVSDKGLKITENDKPNAWVDSILELIQ